MQRASHGIAPVAARNSVGSHHSFPIPVLLVGLLLLFAAGHAFAGVTGTVIGTLRDQSGKPIAGALVTLSAPATIDRTDMSDRGGHYAFTGIAPGTYTVTASEETFEQASSPVSVTVDKTSVIDMSLATAVQLSSSKVHVAKKSRLSPATTYTVTATNEQVSKSQPGNLYQMQGDLFAQPGVTTNSYGVSHIRGAQGNQIGYDIDGVPVNDPQTNYFATNFTGNPIMIGMKSLDLVNGGADASYGDATGSFLNELTMSGRDFATDTKDFGGTLEATLGPDHGWDYRGTSDQFGGIIDNGKIDYYIGGDAFANYYPGNTGIQSVPSANADVAKVGADLGHGTTITTFYSHGFEQYDMVPDPEPLSSPDLKFDPNAGTAINTGTYQQDHEDLSYNMEYLNITQSFSPKTFLSYRLSHIYNDLTVNEASTYGYWETHHSDQVGHQLDLTAQATPTYQIRAGLWYLPSTTYYRSVSGIYDTVANLGNYGEPWGYTDYGNKIKPTQTVFYLANRLQPAGSHLTFDFGERFSQENLQMQVFPSYTDKAADPRAGLTYVAGHGATLRASYAQNSQYPVLPFVERLFPEDGFAVPTASDPGSQLTNLQYSYQQYNRLGADHSRGTDIGYDQVIRTKVGEVDSSVTYYRRRNFDLIESNQSSFYSYPVGYVNGGTGHTSGVEVKLSKLPRNVTDWHGWLSYTNQVDRANVSDDTGFDPSYLYVGATGTSLAPLRGEYPTDYDQRHTIGAVATKRIARWVETSVVYDGGSGFPFINGGYAGIDAQHSSEYLSATPLNEVPIVLPNGSLQPASPFVGSSGWHHKVSLNTNFPLTGSTSLFLNIDNVFDHQTVTNYGNYNPLTYATYYLPPTPSFPEGKIIYESVTQLPPIFVSFGIREKF